jgi:peptidoglycan/xylan/chitin deacetylase (PgdA/CDA1 family)
MQHDRRWGIEGGVGTTLARHGLGKAAVAAALETFHLASRAGIGRARRPRALIFTLHHVRPAVRAPFAPNAHLEVTPQFLDVALSSLIADGFKPVRLEDLPDHVRDGNAGDSYFAFTLDDGYRNNRDHALPVFKRHNVPHTIFVTRGFVERTHSAWWETAATLLGNQNSLTFDFGSGLETLSTTTVALKSLAFARLAAAIRSGHQDERIQVLDIVARDAGLEPLDFIESEIMDSAELAALADSEALVSLGAHSLTHPSLAHVTPERLHAELNGSADYIGEITGKRPATFAYPYGSVCAAGPREFAASGEAGFKLAVTTQPGVIDPAGLTLSPFSLPRISLNGHFQRARYVRALASGLPFRIMKRRSGIEA